MVIDRAQLCDALGVSDSAISAWERKGMPVVRKGRGRGQKSLYNLDAVRAWQSTTGAGLGMHGILARATKREARPAPREAMDIRGLARGIAVAAAAARVTCLEEMAVNEFDLAPPEAVELLDLYLFSLDAALARAGIRGVGEVLEERAGEAAWPTTIEQILVRARAEVPSLDPPNGDAHGR